MGTSLTDDQAAQLRQHGHRTPIVATDADLAGRLAAADAARAERTLEIARARAASLQGATL